MLCYKDRTFCPYWKNCSHGDTCVRALTDEVLEDAKRICLAIAQYGDEPKCFKAKEAE